MEVSNILQKPGFPWKLTIKLYRLTQREAESKESWRAVDAAVAEEFNKLPFSQWEFGGGEAVRNSTRILKVNKSNTYQTPASLTVSFPVRSLRST